MVRSTPTGRSEPELVTALFTDIEGSTALARRLGPRLWAETLAGHHRIVGAAIATHAGRVVQTEGDSFLALFPDAAAAIDAALDAQHALSAYEWGDAVGRLNVRMGAHTGLVEHTDPGYVGLDLHLAARVLSAANGGQILITATTRRRLGCSSCCGWSESGPAAPGTCRTCSTGSSKRSTAPL